jgi:cytochrome P450
MAERVEMPEPHQREELPYMIPLAVTMSILAVLVAISTLFGHRASTERLSLQTKVADQWAYYQAKNSRLRQAQGLAVLLDTLMPADKQKAAEAREKYIQEVERYAQDKEAISEPAKDLENELELEARKEDRFDASEVILEIGLIICSLTLLTRKKDFWYSGIGLGVAGTLMMITGFLLR